MSLRKALAYSSNTIAVKTAEMLGESYEDCIDIMIDYLKNFGITSVMDTKASNNDRNFSALTLGGMYSGISPLEMAAAYGTLANGGVYVEPIIFTTISTYDGDLIINNTPEEVKVVSADVAYVMTDMLSAVVTEGLGASASISSGMPVAGKTGTTNDSLAAWFVGYTPYYVGATYIGDDGGKDPDTGKEIARRSVKGGSGTTARLWSKVMTRVHSNLTVTKFKVPDNVYFSKINPNNGGISSSGSDAAFLDGTAPNKFSSYTNSDYTNNSNDENENEDENGENTVEDETQTPTETPNETPPAVETPSETPPIVSTPENQE
jgi:penicillin-binding protein 1A